MNISLLDEENAVVKIPASVINEETGDCVEDGFLVYTISLDYTDDPYNSPIMDYCEKHLEFPHKADRDYAMSTVWLGLDSRYRIDDEAPKFSDIMEQVEEEWWSKFGCDMYEWVSPTHDEPGYWRSKQ